MISCSNAILEIFLRTQKEEGNKMMQLHFFFWKIELLEM